MFEVIRNIELVYIIREIPLEEKEIIVYPDPSNGRFSISLFNTTEAEIFNQEGVLLERRYLAPGDNAVDA